MKNIDLNTNVDSLKANELISVRTYNCCQENGLTNVRDIVNYKNTNGAFSSIIKCGKKTEMELEKILELVVSSQDYKSVFFDGIDDKGWYMLELAYSELAEKYPEFSISLPKYESFVSFLFDEVNDICFKNASGSCDENRAFRYDVLLKVSELKECGYFTGLYLMILSRRKEELKCAIDRIYKSEYYKENILADKELYLSARYEQLLEETVPVRCRNVIQRQYKSFYEFKEVILDFNTNDFLKFGNIGMKSLKDFEDFIDVMNEEISRVVNMTDKQISIGLLKMNMQFLNDESAVFVQEFYERKNYYPLFYLLQQYILSSNENNIMVFSMYYGCSGCRVNVLNDIAKSLNLSRERVRQILTKKPEISHDFLKGIDKSHYSFINEKIVVDNECLEDEVIGEECISGGFVSFAFLCTLISDFRVLEIGMESLLIKNDVLNRVDTGLIRLRLKEKKDEPRYVEEKIYIEHFLCSFIGEEEILSACLLAEMIARNEYNLNIENGCLIFEVNRYDISDIVYGILKEKNEPMTSQEIWVILKEQCASEVKAKNNDSVVRAIVNDSRFVYNRSSVKYSLREWGDAPMTLRECMKEILASKEEPVHASVITDEVKKYYPTYTEKNVISTVGSQDDDFVRFSGGLIGLKNRAYDDSFEIITPDMINRRLGFDANFERFRDFIFNHNRYPLYNEDDEQDTLARWYNNVENRVLNLTDEQIESYYEFVSRFDDVPHSKKEYVCYSMCRRVEEYQETGHWPSKKDSATFYRWFYKYITNETICNDRRDNYIAEIIEKYPNLRKVR